MPSCHQCGAASVEDGQVFCRACGTPLASAASTFDTQPVRPGATAAEPATIEYVHLGGPGGPAGPVDGPAAGRRGVGRILAAAAAVAALAGGAFLAYSVFFDQAGAKSPEEAVTRLLEAVADQDGVAALQVLDPGETEGFDDLYRSLQKRLDSTGLGSEDGQLLDAVSVELEDLDVEVEQKGDHAARVYVRDGRLRISVDEDRLPEEYRDVYDAIEPETLAHLRNVDLGDELDDVFLTTVEHDGRWFVSPLTTAGEYLVQSEGLPALRAAAFDAVADEDAPDTRSAKEPEDALQVLTLAISSDRVEYLLGALPAEEVAALRPFTAVLQKVLAEYPESDLTLRELDTDFEDLGDGLGRLTVKHARLEGVVAGQQVIGTLDGTCLTHVVQVPELVYQDEGSSLTQYVDQEIEDCLPTEVRDATGIDAVSVVLHQTEDGEWQVDPRATLVAYATRVIENIDGSLLRDVLGLNGVEDY